MGRVVLLLQRTFGAAVPVVVGSEECRAGTDTIRVTIRGRLTRVVERAS